MAADLSGLFRPADDSRVPLSSAKAEAEAEAEGGGWTLTVDGERAKLDGSGDPVTALRLLCGATWNGVPVSGIEPVSPDAAALLDSWGL